MTGRRPGPGVVLAALLLTAGGGPLARTAAPAGSPDYRITLDGAASQVTFELGAVFHTVQGHGRVTDAVLHYDPADGSLTGAIRVPAPALDTGNKRRDRKMHEQVLKSAEHGEIILRLQRADGDLDPVLGGDLQIEGELVLLGQSHPVSFPVVIRVTDAEEGSIQAAGSFMVPYVAWGLEDPSVVFLRVDKEVKVSFAAAGRLTARETGQP